MLLIALRTVDAPKVARVDGLDREEYRLAPGTLALEEIADSSGYAIKMS
jgi:hypothetical protein